VADRRSQILEYVIERERVDVHELSERFGVSQVTVRKDLDHLEQNGLVRRQHGYALAVAPDNLRSRLAFHYDTKRRIAAAAADLVPHGATVMVESGSCCALLADELSRMRRGVTIITNSAFIADFVRNGQAAVVLLGGDYQAESQVTVGPLVEQCLAGFHVEYAFVGVDGYTPETGFTGKNHLRAAVVAQMARRSDHVVVLTESLKFPRQGAVPLLPASAVTRVVTDEGLDATMQADLTAAGITVSTVAVS
jgi:DeoR/GlpR family transcriptional regulator of sugar metabolism